MHLQRFIQKVFLRSILSVLLATTWVDHLRAQVEPTPMGVFRDGEKLTYKVKWKFLRLGTITLETRKSNADSGVGKYLVRIEAKSSLPILRFHRKSESLLDPGFLFSENLTQFEYEDGDAIETRVQYDRWRQRSTLVERNRTKNFIIRTLESSGVKPYLDAISMWFYARSKVHSAQTCTVQTLRDFELKPTRLKFSSEAEEFDIGAVDADIRAIRMVGATASAGQSAGGFEGDFESWFSDDAAAVLLKAEIKIAVGKVKIELEEWERPGWEPPTWKEQKLAKN